jgi:hypothetical protein
VRLYLISVIMLLFLSSSCRKKMIILLENHSDFDSVKINCYTNNTFEKSVWIRRSMVGDHFKYSDVTIPDKDTFKLKFTNETMNVSDSCVVYKSKLKKHSFILVTTQKIPYPDSTKNQFFCSLYYTSSMWPID